MYVKQRQLNKYNEKVKPLKPSLLYVSDEDFEKSQQHGRDQM